MRYGRYNKMVNAVEILFAESNILLRLDCNKWEYGLKTTLNSQGAVDALAIENPLEYARLVLSGEMQDWVNAQDEIW